MLILLPPSEGKTPATAGDAVDWASLSFPGLNTYRAKVLEGLGTVSAHEDALALLGVGASLRADVERNTRLHAEPAAPAHQVYSGVLYDALGYDSLTAAQKRKADESVLVISALWGAIRFGDSVPAYRLSMATALPDVGRLASFWKPQLTAALAAATDRGTAGGLPLQHLRRRVGSPAAADRCRERVHRGRRRAEGGQPLRQAHPGRTRPAPADPPGQGAADTRAAADKRRPKSGPRNWSRARPGSRTP